MSRGDRIVTRSTLLSGASHTACDMPRSEAFMPRLRDSEARPFGDRAGPLIEEAAERSRVSMRTRLERLRVSWRSILQAGVASGVAWVIATEVFGHERPFFAPVAAIIVLGLTISQRGRRAVE